MRSWWTLAPVLLIGGFSCRAAPVVCRQVATRQLGDAASRSAPAVGLAGQSVAVAWATDAGSLTVSELDLELLEQARTTLTLAEGAPARVSLAFSPDQAALALGFSIRRTSQATLVGVARYHRQTHALSAGSWTEGSPDSSDAPPSLAADPRSLLVAWIFGAVVVDPTSPGADRFGVASLGWSDLAERARLSTAEVTPVSAIALGGDAATATVAWHAVNGAVKRRSFTTSEGGDGFSDVSSGSVLRLEAGGGASLRASGSLRTDVSVLESEVVHVLPVGGVAPARRVERAGAETLEIVRLASATLAATSERSGGEYALRLLVIDDAAGATATLELGTAPVPTSVVLAAEGERVVAAWRDETTDRVTVVRLDCSP